MTTMVHTRAFGNIALIKYWGKTDGNANLPATSSISLALDSLKTETTIRQLSHGPDEVVINGQNGSNQRVISILDNWRSEGLLAGHWTVFSQNFFPTGAGLASSASGFAALIKALSTVAERKLDETEISRLARRASGSAARSITGGLSAVEIGDNPSAREILPPGEIPWGMVAVIVDDNHKKIGSREGMEHCRLNSPYYPAWVEQSRKDYKAMLTAVEKRDFTSMGRITESNCLAMHACMMAARPPLNYWNPATLAVIHHSAQWREEGLENYFTIDAGPQVFLLAKKENLEDLARRARNIIGVRQALTALPAGGAEIIACG